MKHKSILSSLSISAASLLLLTLLISILTMHATAAEPYQAVSPTPSVTPALSSGQVISGTILLFPDRPPVDFGGDDVELPTDEMSEEEWQEIEAEIDRNIQQLQAEGKLPPAIATAVSLEWPLSPSDTFNDYGYHAIRNFVDHNPNYPGQLLDYNCGDRTYDMANGFNHTGTDFSLWPFPWNKMDNGDVQVVAAAAGVIVSKRNGNYDRNCSSQLDVPWNAVSVRHSDGSVAVYGHLKNGSLTGKAVGSAVQTGEYLGLVGSSGRSGGPHLHLTLRDGARQIVDPYQGTCNTSSAHSWWTSQRPYYDSAINLLTTGDARAEYPSCPSPAITHIKDNFSPGERIYFAIYYRDLLNGQTTHFTIYEPDGSVFQRVTHTNSNPYSPASYRYWAFETRPNAKTGLWRWEVSFEGQTYQTSFRVGHPAYITVTSPRTGDKWNPGSTHMITWDDNLEGNVRLELHRYNVSPLTIADSVPSNGVYTWTIPVDIADSNAYRVRIVDVANDAVYADSAFFTIGNPAVNDLWNIYIPIVIKSD